MSSPLETHVAGALRAQERFHGSPTLTINEVSGAVVGTYPCSASTEGRGTVYGDADGLRMWVVQLTVFLRKELLPVEVTADLTDITADSDDETADDSSAPPRDGMHVTYKGRAYRVHYVTDLEGAFRLRLADRYSDQ